MTYLVLGIQEGNRPFISRSSSMRRNGLISYMENHMVDGLKTLLIGGLEVSRSLLMETLSIIEEGVGYTS